MVRAVLRQRSEHRARSALLFACAVATVVALPLVSAHAGTGGTEFDTFYDTIVDWAQGSLGKALALSMFLVGIGMGVVRGSVIAAVPAIGGALGLFIVPKCIDAIVTLPSCPARHSSVLPAVELALDQL